MIAKAAIVATLVVALIAIIVAAATTINSPQGTLFDGAVYTITWSGAPSGTGILGYCSASDTNNCKNINENVDLSKNSYAWTVDASPGQYVLFINDGTGNKYSGTFNVISRGSSSGGSSPTASGGSSSNSTASANPTDSSGATGTGSTGGAPATTIGNTGATTTPTGSSSGSTPAPNKSGASTLRSSLLGLFVGLGVVASVMIQLF